MRQSRCVISGAIVVQSEVQPTNRQNNLENKDTRGPSSPGVLYYPDDQVTLRGFEPRSQP